MPSRSDSGETEMRRMSAGGRSTSTRKTSSSALAERRSTAAAKNARHQPPIDEVLGRRLAVALDLDSEGSESEEEEVEEEAEEAEEVEEGELVAAAGLASSRAMAQPPRRARGSTRRLSSST